ncbi:MAG: DegT/DnrJ/EryC1/StrS aminotransferase family protein [Verrucomicrobia bacterium]|nr:DegT/DnrJ/EryC1/StrS aminotransferase family protein [Verrucomicrobiota bacterium]
MDSITKSRPLPGWPQFGEEEISATVAVLRSGKVNYWTGGICKEFEAQYAANLGVKHTISAANGTVTLEMALLALGIGPGDEVVVTPRTFMASISCVVTVGARPVFADIERESGNLSAETVARALTPKTKAVIPVHLGGWPCEMDALMQLAADRRIAVIEDCAQAHGATYRGRAIGSIGHVNSFSFCQDKIITTGGEGGLLATNDSALWEKLWSLKDHGKSFDACFRRQWPPGFRWLHESFGTNYRMTEMQAAIGREALKKLPEWTRIRQRHSAALSRCLQEFPCIRVPEVPAHMEHARYKYYCYVEAGQLRDGWSRDRVMAEINALGVPCFSGSCSEVYLEKAFDRPGFRPPERLPVARELGETSLMFLVHPTLGDGDVAACCERIAHVLRQAGR